MDEQEVKKIIEEFKETYPKDFFKILDKNACGYMLRFKLFI